MKKKNIYIILFLFALLYNTYAQQIITDNTQQPNTLIKKLVENNHTSINNVSKSIIGNLNYNVSWLLLVRNY